MADGGFELSELGCCACPHLTTWVLLVVIRVAGD